MKTNFIKMALTNIGVILFLSIHISGAAIPERPEPARFINDIAGAFQESECDSLENRLAAYSDTTGTQIVVVVVPDLEGQDAASYATEIGEKWGIGSADFDNGVVILIKPKNDKGSGEVFIATGYGLEGAIPDAYASRIISEIMIPHFIRDDYFSAVVGACDKIIRLADGERFISSAADDNNASVLIIGVIIIVFLIFIFTRGKGNSGSGSSSDNKNKDKDTYSRSTVIPTSSNSSVKTPPARSFGGGSFGGGGAGAKW
jgi:uncharacterized protein